VSTHPPTLSASSGRVFVWRLALACVLATAAGAIGLGGGTVLLQHKFAQARSVRVDLDRALPGSMNILLLGSDSRAFVGDTGEQGFGDTSDVGGQRADVIIILRVEAKARRALLVSIPRDTYVRLPKHKGQVLINQSFEDGPQGVINAIKSNFGVPIHHYAQIDFNGFRTMVDAIGGVRMYIPAPSRDKPPPGAGTNGSGLDIKTAGCQTLSGGQALAWVRSRYFQYYEAGKWRSDPTSDIGRISRQQDFLRRLMAQAVEKGAFNPIKANRLADAAMANLTVDSGFNVKDALRIVQAFRPVGPAGVEMMALPTRNVGQHLAVSNDAQPVLARLRGEVEPDNGGTNGKAPKVSPSEVKVRVLNGTGTPGQAGDAAADLGAAGFGTGGLGDADRFGYERTEIRYGRGAQPKAALLARYLGGAGKLVSDSTIGGTDLVLVTGGDWKGVAPPPGAGQAAAPSTTPTTAAPTSTTAKGATPPSAPTPAGGPAQPVC
jgi:polyisoprenyl-teichoic acid--peptidoglycan teichoic acid transferase